MSVVCDRACRAQLLKFWSKVMLYHNLTPEVQQLCTTCTPVRTCYDITLLLQSSLEYVRGVVSELVREAQP